MEEVGWGDDVGCRDNGLVGCTLLGVDLRFEFTYDVSRRGDTVAEGAGSF